ncbi:hypothetical protein NEF87_003519 [Candidatus Lokiarchaeum ossiferum]|uniref:DUF981 family protein n=1 Tax=Candidatus Lokiarchaeum ossiferum TaxID=2951803 RepID=A0ABY6HXR6_9ARCH|nr:hypothetical protein NEF87_003519 [Candidatus Lokiarchaeum sp. B-35]
MILQTGLYAKFVDIFVDSGAIMLVICGLMALVWFGYEGVRRGFIKSKNESWERDTVSRVLKIIILLGLILGVVVVATGIMTMVLDMPPSYAYRDFGDVPLSQNHFDWFTSILLLLMGVAMFLKPLEDVPLASLIGIIAGAGVALILALTIPQSLVTTLSPYVNMKWVLFGIFVVVATMVGVALKFWVGALEAISKVISWPPFALLAAALCLTQGFMIWITGNTLIMIGY